MPLDDIDQCCSACGTWTPVSKARLLEDEGWRCGNRSCRQQYHLRQDAIDQLKYPKMTAHERLKAKVRAG